MTASRVVEKGTREALPPRLENWLERAGGKMGCKYIVERIDDADTGNCAGEKELACSSRPDYQLARRIDPYDLAVLFEFERND